MSRLKAGVVEGRSDGPVRMTSEVLSRRREGAYWLLSLAARPIAERAAPGQFVEVAVGAPGTLLRRPFSIARVSRQGASAGTVDVVFDAHGPGTEWLTTLDAHDVLDVIGPLGVPFPLPQRKVACLLVGGGYGIAPLLFLAESLLRKGLRVDMINGAATGERILGAIEAKRLSASVVFTTDDGSYGTPGRVTDVLDGALERAGAGVVYACGPNPMLRAVSERCRARGVPVQVALEERMGCGLGVCFTCVVPVRGSDGEVRNRRACLEGPVFNGARIDWDAWGIPGAPPGTPPDEDPVPEEPPHAADGAETTGEGGSSSAADAPGRAEVSGATDAAGRVGVTGGSEVADPPAPPPGEGPGVLDPTPPDARDDRLWGDR